MMPLTESELALNVSERLDETDLAITLLGNQGIDIPAEAIELRTIMRRCLWAERQLQELRDQLGRLDKDGIPDGYYIYDDPDYGEVLKRKTN